MTAPEKFKEGTSVRVELFNGAWFPATIVGWNGTGLIVEEQEATTFIPYASLVSVSVQKPLTGHKITVGDYTPEVSHA